MSVENAYIALPLGIFRKDAIISIRRGIEEIDNGTFNKKQIFPAIYVRTIDGFTEGCHFTSIEERDNIYYECVKILTTNN